MPLERDHVVLLLAGALVGGGLATVLPVLETPPSTDTRPDPPRSEVVRQRGIAHVAGGEAAAALPVLPLETGGNGTLLGRTEAADVAGPAGSLLDWHRPCLPKGRSALPDPANGSAPLRYLDPGEVDVDDPYQGRDPWYAPRHGHPVRGDALPTGRPVYATWGAGPDAAATDPVVVLLKLNASARTAAHDPFTEAGVLAFAARAPPACRLVAVAPDVPPGDEGAGARQVVEDHPRLAWPPAPEVAVDLASGDVWDPAVVVRDTAATLHPPPLPTS